MKTYAFLNHGRWLAACPKHPEGGVMQVDPSKDKVFICPVCYPGAIARLTVVRDGKITKIFDTSAQRTARMMAEKDGAIYEIEYPLEMNGIVITVGKRETPNQNWMPGETLEFLEADNKIHGVR